MIYQKKKTNNIIDNKYQSFIPVPAGILITRMVEMFDSWVCLGCVFGESWVCLGCILGVSRGSLERCCNFKAIDTTTKHGNLLDYTLIKTS